MTLDDILFEAEEKMLKSVEVVEQEFTSIRTGKASPDLVNNLAVDAYGSQMKLKEMAAITTPEPRLILIQPWDGSTVDSIRKAIEESKIGITPQVDGNKIRLPIPQLSQERRLDLVKTIKRIGEEGRVAIRGIRRNAMDDLKKIQKDGKITEDDLKSAEKEIQKLTDDNVAALDKSLEKKEAELMKV